MDNFTVTIDYKDKETNSIVQRTYSLEEYCDMCSNTLKKIINDIENYFSQSQNGKSKEDWDESTKIIFNKIRHRMLDSSNAFKRLPTTLKYNGKPISNINVSEAILNTMKFITHTKE